jgi:hypothetical protein
MVVLCNLGLSYEKTVPKFLSPSPVFALMLSYLKHLLNFGNTALV